jgi:hypothetical protein
MFSTSQDLLNLALAVGFGLIAIFLSMALFYLTFVLRDIAETTKALKHTARQIDSLIVQPARIFGFVLEKVKDVAGLVEGHLTAGKKRGK